MPSPILFGASGNPEPSTDIVRRLRELDPRLDLTWLSGAGKWAVRMHWLPDDRRRERIKRGEMPSDVAFDIIGYLPVDCSVDEAPPLLARMLRYWPNEDISKMVEGLTRWNSGGAQQELVEGLMEDLSDAKYGANDGKVSGKRTLHTL